MLTLHWEYIRKKRKGGIVYSSWYKLRLYAQCAQERLDCFHIIQKKKEHVERGEGRKKGWQTQDILHIPWWAEICAWYSGLAGNTGMGRIMT